MCKKLKNDPNNFFSSKIIRVIKKRRIVCWFQIHWNGFKNKLRLKIKGKKVSDFKFFRILHFLQCFENWRPLLCCMCESEADFLVSTTVQKGVYIGQPPLGNVMTTCPLSSFDSLWRLKPWTLSFKFPRTKNWPGKIFQSLKRWKFVKDNTHIVRGKISSRI
jgi:hypothetical protein